jgi:hypothetical protein
MPPGLTIPSIFVAVDRFSSPIRAMRGALNSFVARSEIGLAKVERGFRRLLSPMTGFQNMLRGLGVYIGLFSALILFRNAVGIMADFEQAQVNISAVTGKTIQQNKALADQARVLALRYGEAAKSVLDLDLNLIKAGFTNGQALQMAGPIVSGAVALKAVPDELSKTVGAVIRAFKMPSGNNEIGKTTQDIVDLLAKAADLSALDWTDLQTMLPRAMQTASLAGMDFKDLITLFAMARNAQVHVASGSVAIKNMLIKGAIWNDTFSGMLDKIIASPDAIKKAYKMFGSRSLVTALPLAEAKKLGDMQKFRDQLEKSFSGYAEGVATKRLDSIRGKITLFKRAWEELVLAIDDGRGPLGTAIKQYLDVGSAMLLIAADSDIARQKLSTMDGSVVALAHKYLKWLKIAGYVTAGMIGLRVALVLFNASLVACRLMLIGWNITLGISASLGWANVAALRGNIVALTVLRGILAVVTAAQFLWNAALAANPIGLIVIAIASLVAWILILVNNWYSWGAAVSYTLGPLGILLSMIMSIQHHWNIISAAFTNDGMLAGIRAIGKALLDSVLYPIQQLYQLLSHVPGMGSLSRAAKVVELYRNQMWQEQGNGASSTWGEGREVITPQSPQEALQNYMEHFGRVSIDINNKSTSPVTARSSGIAAINMSPQSTFDDF